jgi:ribose transport system permease protein
VTTSTSAATEPTEAQQATEHKRRAATGMAERVALPVVWLAVIVFFGIMHPDEFLSSGNFANIFGSQAVLVVLTLGLLIPLTVGDYDLSVASVLTLSTMLVGILNVNHDVPILLAVLIALGVGLLCGIINGTIIVLFEIDPFIVTLGTGTVYAGIVSWISNSATITGIDESLTRWVLDERILGIPIEAYYGLALCILIWYVLDFTPMGQRLLFVGQGRTVAKLSGVNVSRVRWGAFATSGLIAAAAGVLYAGTLGAADPSSGASFLLPAFAAAFLGATSIRPGRFNPWGTIIAVYALITGITGLQIMGAQNFVQQLFYGIALVAAVTLSQVVKRRREAAARA